MIKINNIYEWPVQRQLIFFLIFFLIVFYLGFQFLIFGLMHKLNTVKKQETSLKQQLGGAVDSIINARYALAIYKNYTSYLPLWEESLVDYQNLSNLLNVILKIGETNNLAIVVFDPEDKVSSGRYSKVPIKVIAVGSYHQIAEFFSDLANLDKIVSISKLNISNENQPDIIGTDLAKKANAENLLTATFILEIYYVDIAHQMEETKKAIEKLKSLQNLQGNRPATESTKP